MCALVTGVQTCALPIFITGFLGSGKTTLLSHLLRRPDMGRTAVIINEFGEVGLDHDLVSSATDDTILMESGCICCTIRGDLVDTMRDKSEEHTSELQSLMRISYAVFCLKKKKQQRHIA